MTLARFDRTVTDNRGDVVSGATVTVRSEVPGQPLAPLYSDRAGTTPMGNPIATDANGDFGFYVGGGFYQIEVVNGVDTKTLRYVGIGLAQGSDAASSGTIEREVIEAGAVTVSSDDADVILINKTVGEATSVVLPDPETATKKVRIVDRKYDAATNNITLTSAGTAKTVMGGTQYVIDSNGGSIELMPLDDGSGWV